MNAIAPNSTAAIMKMVMMNRSNASTGQIKFEVLLSLVESGISESVIFESASVIACTSAVVIASADMGLCVGVVIAIGLPNNNTMNKNKS